MNAISDYEKFVQRARAALSGLAESPAFDPKDWASPKHRFGAVLQMIRDGATDEEISAKWPGVKGDVLGVYHLIAEGKTHEDPREFDPEAEKKRRKKKEDELKAAYRRRYGGKGRGVR